MRHKLFMIKYYFWITFGLQVLGCFFHKKTYIALAEPCVEIVERVLTPEEEQILQEELKTLKIQDSIKLDIDPYLFTLYEQINSLTDSNSNDDSSNKSFSKNVHDVDSHLSTSDTDSSPRNQSSESDTSSNSKTHITQPHSLDVSMSGLQMISRIG